MKRVLIISGRQGSGKTTTSDLIKQLLINADKAPFSFKFADPLYRMHDACLPILKMYKVRGEEMGKDGELLQVLGTEYGRNRISQDVWVNSCRARVDEWLERHPNNVALIDDCRFENEFDAFKDAYKVRLSCAEGVRKDRCSYWREDVGHPSETGLDRYDVMGRFDLTWNTEFARPEVVALGIYGAWKGEL